MADESKSQDQKYLDLIINKINVCKTYRPKFGQGKDISLKEFKALYGADPFYSWFGLDNSLIYAAHKTAGGITSLYRQIGTGCEQLFRQIIRDQLQLTAAQSAWSYTVKISDGKERKLSLDARISLEDLQLNEHKRRVNEWMAEVTTAMKMDSVIATALKGPVFEVRQGYKSKDSKRQNADIGNAGTAYTQGYLPVVAILSTQIDRDVADRYINAGWLLLRGHINDSPLSSTYAFCDEVLDYDLAGFLKRNSVELKQTVEQVLEALLTPVEPLDITDRSGVVDKLKPIDELEAAERLESDDEADSEYQN